MSRKAPVLKCSEEERNKAYELAHSKTEDKRFVERAKIIVCLLENPSVQSTAEKLSLRPNTVINWRRRFESEGIHGLYDRPRPGKPHRYGEEIRAQLLHLLEEEPPEGFESWDRTVIAERLGVSVHAVWRLLRSENLFLQRQRRWDVPTDPEFAPKAVTIVGIYLNPPSNALVVRVCEHPYAKAQEQPTGYIRTNSGRIVRSYADAGTLEGSLPLSTALRIATEANRASVSSRKRKMDVLEFLDEIAREHSTKEEIHVISDRCNANMKNESWQSMHPNFYFHFTQPSESWLHQAKVWFGFMSRNTLHGKGLHGQEDVRNAIDTFVHTYHEAANPFVWRTREERTLQPPDTIDN